VFETLREATRKALAQVRDAARERTPALRTNGTSGLDGRSLYAALTGDSELPGQTKITIAPSPTAPGATAPTTNGTHAPAAMTERHEAPSAKEATNGKNGAHAPNGHANGSNGVASVARARESVRSDVAGTYPSSAQLNEIVAGHRALSRRIDLLERSIEQSVQSALRNVESGVVQKTGEKLGQSFDRTAEALRGAMDGSFTRHGSDVRAALDDLAKRVDEARDPRIDELAKSQDSLRGALQALKVQLSALHGSADGRFENLEKGQSGIAARVDEAKARLGEIDRLAEALHPLAAIEARVSTLGDVERRIIELPDGAAFDAMSRRLDGLHATVARLGEVEKKLQALPELDAKLRVLPEIERRLGGLVEIEKKLGTLATVDRRLDGLERDRVTATTLETRLGTFATVLGSEIDGMLENRFANGREEAKADRIALTDAIHRLGKLVAEVGHGLGNRIDALTSQVARVEARTTELDARTDRMAQRLEEIVARVDATSETMARSMGALSALEKRMDVHFAGSAKTLEDGFSTAHSHIRALNVEVTKTGQILHRLSDDSQKKGWFR
jgi:chromosome segregation ATPase